MAAEQRARAFQLAYNLDYGDAVAAFRQAINAEPDHPAGYRGLAAITWLRIAIFDRSSLSVTDYLGRSGRARNQIHPSSAADVAQYRENVTRAVTLSEKLVATHPRSAEAHYQLGASVGVMASYEGVIEGRLRSAFIAARHAYKAHEEVLRLEPGRKDAGLIVGTYRYLVSSLSLPARWFAYLAGFGGGRARGLRMVEEAAAFRSEAQTEARMLLVLLYNRERRFDEALRLLQELQREFPRNRFLWLNEGVTAARGRKNARAEEALTNGLTMMHADTRERAFGEEATWHYQRGAVRVSRRDVDGARADLERALSLTARPWVQGRAHIELGKLSDLAGDRRRAQALYDKGATLCASDDDPAGASVAARLRKSGFR